MEEAQSSETLVSNHHNNPQNNEFYWFRLWSNSSFEANTDFIITVQETKWNRQEPSRPVHCEANQLFWSTKLKKLMAVT